MIANGYEFLPASREDIPEIAEIYHSLVGTPGCTWDYEYPSAETAECDLNMQALYILKKDGKIIAAASAGDFDELGHLPWKLKKPCELARIGVAPAYQKQGVGTRILQHIMKMVKEKGFDGIRMLVSTQNDSALAMYERNGFVKCGQVFMFDHDFYCYQIAFDSEGGV